MIVTIERSLFLLVLSVTLCACNLQTAPPSTPTSEIPPTLTQAAPPPASPTPELPPLRATPTQFPLLNQPQPAATITLVAPGTINSSLAATLDPAQVDQRFEVEAREGETVGIVYEVIVNRGAVLMVLQGPGGIVWQMTLTASESSRADVTVPQAGVYELLIDAQNLSGEYKFRFE